MYTYNMYMCIYTHTVCMLLSRTFLQRTLDKNETPWCSMVLQGRQKERNTDGPAQVRSRKHTCLAVWLWLWLLSLVLLVVVLLVSLLYVA